MRPLGYKRNFAWHLAGNIAYSLAQWLLLVILANLSSSTDVGRFALMLAIAAPIFLTVGMKLRTAQATDVDNDYHRREYRLLRHFLNLAATALTLCVAMFANQSDVILALVGLCIAKSSEGLSQADYGYLQRLGRLDVVSRSLLARSLLGTLCFTAGLLSTGDLAGATWGLALGWTVVQLLIDNPAGIRMERAQGSVRVRSTGKARRILRLARECAPLGADAGVSSFGVNAPRYVIEGYLGSVSLGIFASSAYLTQSVSMVSSSMASVLLPRLARAYRRGNRYDYLSVLGKLTIFGIGVAGAAGIGAFIFGESLLGFLLGEAYARHDLLMALMLSAGVTTLHRMLCKGLEASRRFKTYLLVDVATTICILAAALLAVPQFGVIGGAYALTFGFSIGSVISVGALLQTAHRLGPYQTGGHDE